jgi:hypothetical protein
MTGSGRDQYAAAFNFKPNTLASWFETPRAAPHHEGLALNLVLRSIAMSDASRRTATANHYPLFFFGGGGGFLTAAGRFGNPPWRRVVPALDPPSRGVVDERCICLQIRLSEITFADRLRPGKNVFGADLGG